MFANLVHCLQAAILGAIMAPVFLTSAWAQPPDDFRVDYTGALFGYYRIENPNHVKDGPEGSPIRKFHDNRLGHESRLLLGMGDNFAPEFGASIQLVGTGDCEQRIKSGASDPYPPEILYKQNDRYARRADCDNVANFLMQEKYRAVVPGREDFIYSAQWLRQLAWSLKEISGPEKDEDKLHMLAANLRLKAGTGKSQGRDNDKRCPLLFAGSRDEDPVVLISGTVCVSSLGASIPEAQDWVERLDLATGLNDERGVTGEFVDAAAADPWQALAMEIDRKAQSSAEVRRQLLINQVAQFVAMHPETLLPPQSEPLVKCIGQLAKHEVYATSGEEIHFADNVKQLVPGACGAKQNSGQQIGRDAYEALQKYEGLCHQPLQGNRDWLDICNFAEGMLRIVEPICNDTRSCITPGTRRIDQAKFDFLLNYEERKAGRDALLRVFAKEEENIGYTFSDRKASSGKLERTLLIGVVGVETMQAISSANFSVDVSVQQKSPEKSPGDTPNERPAPKTLANTTISRDVAVSDPLRTLLILLRATKLAADDEAAKPDPTKAFVRTIVMAQMPHTEAEELGAHVRSELFRHSEWGRPSISLILSEAQADHATQDSDVTYTAGAVIPVLTPHPPFDRAIDGLVNPISTVRINVAGIHNEIENNVVAYEDKTALELLSTQLSQGANGYVLANPSIKGNQSVKAEAEEFILAELLKKSRADIVMLERRDVYLDGLPVGYTGYEVCDTFRSQDAYKNPAALSALELGKCRLRVALDRVLWKGDFLERVMVSGKDLKDVLKKAQGVATDEQTLAAHDTVGQWLISFGITTSTPTQLTLLETQGDRFSLPQDSGCARDVNASQSETPYCVNGAVVVDDASYMVLTSDHIAQDSVLYTSLKNLPKDYHMRSNTFLTAELTGTLASKTLATLTRPIETCLHRTSTSRTPMECAQEEHQDRPLFHLDYGKAVAGFNVRKPEGGNAAASNFQGVADTRASQPGQQELDLESAVRVSSDLVGKFPLPLSVGVQTDAEYDRSALGNLSGKPINASYTLNSFTANGFLMHRIPFPGDARTIHGDWGNRALPRTLLVLTPHQYQQQITGSFLSLPYSVGSGEYTRHLPRVTGFVDKLGVRHEGGGTWTKFDRSTYEEGGFQLGVQNNILQSITFVTGAASQLCAANTKQSIAECVAGNKQFPVSSSTTATDLISKTLHASGLYWDVHVQKGVFKDATSGAYGISATLDSKGDFFYQRSPGKSLSTQTRYAFPVTAAINFPILRNLSLSPTYTSFFYESQVTRQSITVNSFMISAHWFYDDDASVPIKRQLFFKGPASLDQTKTAKLK